MKNRIQNQNRRNQQIINNKFSPSKTEFENIEKIITSQYYDYGFNSLTRIQNLALKVIVRDYNCLLVAPTGSGKTEAAVLPVIKLLSLFKGEAGIKVIYVTPLRSLNNDVLRRIIRYADTEKLTVEIRHGDTPAKTKKKITNNPPDILITTPESIPILLTIENLLKAFQSLKWVIIDEVHELVSNERGSHLSLSLERLQQHSRNIITRIGLSATLKNVKETGKFIVGSNQRCAILQDRSLREYDLKIKFVNGSIYNVAKFIVEYIKTNNISDSVLLFTNTRDEPEYFGTILKTKKEVNVDVHHGSLSKEIREDAEYKLRTGAAGIVVCTSSLELGLDIGSVDLVIHYGSPRQVSKLMQRIGRSRHKQREFAKGLIVTNNPDDEIEALAIINRMKHGSIEEQKMHEGALDAMAHHLVGLAMQTRDPVKVEHAYDLVTRAYSFRNVSLFDVESCIEILANHNVIKYDREART